eukprot:gnl/Hemi2/7919_TR2732_c0_g11_i1.p1 gnl/Hemi2/7919_TR2732_c0_g11~~gnl/Hemi2/7919_TR2732_c0_g11_i1.p1  ORF type:complete len:403 (-),score=65.14 gnl/Hemi2/7919_TR2732_c0_g11_i1:211-1419(-)
MQYLRYVGVGRVASGVGYGASKILVGVSFIYISCCLPVAGTVRPPTASEQPASPAKVSVQPPPTTVPEYPPMDIETAVKQKGKLSLADFQLLRTLGTGTFGRVKLCKFRGDNKFYAIKILKKAHIIRLKQLDHILSEKNLLSRLAHPFIVRMYASFQDDFYLYIVLELIAGGELFTYLQTMGRFEQNTARFYAAQIVLAMEYMHKQDIIYRDLKPENILISPQGYVKVTDFGFAKIVRDRTWTLCGTPEYLAPEIIQSKGHNRAVDWWALGILIYEMLAGYPPFYDNNPFGIYRKILNEKPSFPKTIEPDAKDLIKRLLQVDVTKRIGNLRLGAADIKNHKWFKELDWDALAKGTLPAPIIPTIANEPGKDPDVSNFAVYDEADDERPVPISSKDQASFADF